MGVTAIAQRYMEAARVPSTMPLGTFGAWTITREESPAIDGEPLAGWPDMTLLSRWPKPDPNDPYANESGCLRRREIVMEDSRRELSQHLPIWLAARGRVLVTGLGLGCVVRGLLANPAVTHVDVVEIDEDILTVTGAEFLREPRVKIHHGDALTFKWSPIDRWDFAWHDLWTDGPQHLQFLHVQLMAKLRGRVPRQGAWKLPRIVKRNRFPGVLP